MESSLGLTPVSFFFCVRHFRFDLCLNFITNVTVVLNAKVVTLTIVRRCSLGVLGSTLSRFTSLSKRPFCSLRRCLSTTVWFFRRRSCKEQRSLCRSCRRIKVNTRIPFLPWQQWGKRVAATVYKKKIYIGWQRTTESGFDFGDPVLEINNKFNRLIAESMHTDD